MDGRGGPRTPRDFSRVFLQYEWIESLNGLKYLLYIYQGGSLDNMMQMEIALPLYFMAQWESTNAKASLSLFNMPTSGKPINQ